MSTTWLDSSDAYGDTEAYGDMESSGDAEVYGDTEAYGEGEAYGDTEAYDEETRRARERRLALARRRRESRMRARIPRVGPTPPTPRQVISAVRNVDLEANVRTDQLRSRLSAQGRRMTRAEYAAAASVIVSQFMESFDEPDNTYVRAGLRYAPLLLLSTPRRSRGGVDGFVTDPRVVGAVAMAGIAFFGDQRRRGSAVARLDLLAPAQLNTGDVIAVGARPLDRRGLVVKDAVVEWSTSDQSVVSLAGQQGTTNTLTAGSVPAGQTKIALVGVRAGDISDGIYVAVTGGTGGTGGTIGASGTAATSTTAGTSGSGGTGGRASARSGGPKS